MHRSRFALAAVVVLAAMLVSCASLPAAETAGSEGQDDDASYVALRDTYEASQRERGQAAATCLEDKGFPGAVVNSDGTTRIEVSDAQQSAYNQATLDCMKEVCPNCGKPLSRDSLEKLYELQIVARGCLGEFDIETTEPPALQTYLDTPEEQRWNPFLEAGPLISQSDQALKIEETCPDPVGIASYW